MLAYASGALLFIFTRWIRVPSLVGEQHHALEFWIRVLHNTLTYFVILAIGYLIKGHIIPGIKSKMRKQVWSGIGLLVLFGILVGSAIGTMYSGEGDLNWYVFQIHAFVGLFSPLILFGHIIKRWRLKI